VAKPSKAQIEELLNAGDVYTAAEALGIKPISLRVLCKEHGVPWPGAGKRTGKHRRSRITKGNGARNKKSNTGSAATHPEIPKPDSLGRVILKRSQLYRLVWSYPITVLAGEWGISDVGLAKVCKRNNVPKPGLGAWAKMQNGYHVSQPPLPRANEDRDICISGLSEIASEGDEQKPTIWDEERERVAALGPATMPKQEASPHPLTEPSDRSLRRCRADYQGMKRVCLKKGFPITCSEDQIERALKIFNCLAKALEERQFKLTFDSEEKDCCYQSFSSRSGWTSTSEKKCVSQLIVHVLQETVRIELVEQTDSKAYNAEEYPRKEGLGSTWWYSHPSRLYTPNGRLTLHILEDVGSRKSWGDGKKQRVEDCIDGFIRGIITAAESKVLRREERERQERERQEWQRRWEEERRAKEREERRQKQLWQDIEAWEKAKRIREYVAAVAAKAESLKPEDTQIVQVQEWIEWANRVADAWDPIKKNVPELSEYGKKIDSWKNW